MRKLFYPLFIIALLALPFASLAQDVTATYEPGSRARTFFVELGGPGFISANYDFRFKDTRNAWGVRAGLGYFSIDDESQFTVPVQINYLLGKGGNYFEIGGGATYVRHKTPMYFYDFVDGYYENERWETRHRNEVMGTLAFGYRRQPVDGGFNFRAGISPILYKGDFVPYLPYVSFGYSF